MRPTAALAAALALAACAEPPPAYSPDDPLAGARPPQTVYAAPAARKTPLFTAVLPAGYAASDGALEPPVAAMLTRDTAFGEADIVVERYGGPGSAAVSREDYLAHLAEGGPPAPATRTVGGEPLTVYDGLRFTASEREVGPGDPWRSDLGERVAPPRLSLLEGRRFLVGGDAYRLYRCGRLGAWDVLADYRRAQRAGRADAFLSSHPPEERRLVAACFGNWTARAMSEGRPVPAIRRPGLGELRARARAEWERGVVTAEERECVVLRDAPGGFWVLRLRAPAEGFAAEQPGFLVFAATFRPS